MCTMIHFGGRFPKDDAETARLLGIKVKFAENVISRIREALQK